MSVRRRDVFNRLVYDPAGPVGRDLRRRGRRVGNQARLYTPVRHGRLRSSIKVSDPYRGQFGLAINIGSNVVYARAVHEGSRSSDAPRSWRIAQARGHSIPPRRFLTNALPAGRG